MKAFKATHTGGKPMYGSETYEVGKTYTLDGEAKLCENGYHASQRADDVFTYYEDFTEMYEVTLSGSTETGRDKICGTIMTVDKQLTPQEIAEVFIDKNNALCWAAGTGRKEIVQLLIPVLDPKAWESRALRWAAMKGHKECVELLIPVSDPKANDSEALRLAAANGHKEIVELLVPASDPAAVESLGLA